VKARGEEKAGEETEKKKIKVINLIDKFYVSLDNDNY
jgi:hypothetical protein